MGLGRGLDSLFRDNNRGSGPEIVVLRIERIEPNRDQPRKSYDKELLIELASSISEHGILQPLVVRPMGSKYQIVAGERRWRAANIARIVEVPAIVMELDDKKAAEINLIENLQREDLSPVEEANGYKALMTTYKMTQEEVSEAVGKPRSTIANVLRILNLPSKVLEMVSSKALSFGHARALMALDHESDIEKFAFYSIKYDYSVRRLEASISAYIKKNELSEPEEDEKENYSEFFKNAELELKKKLRRNVKITSNGEKGKIQITFCGTKDFEDLITFFSSQSFLLEAAPIESMSSM
jgi:ParB family chromosome partitioning protein